MPPTKKVDKSYEKWLSRWKLYMAAIIMLVSVFVIDTLVYVASLLGLITIENLIVLYVLLFLMVVCGLLIMIFLLIVLGYVLYQQKKKK